MSKKEDKIEIEGVVVEPLPNGKFKVDIGQDGKENIIEGYLAGKMRMHYIKILPGDRVTVELSPYELTKGRITYRQKGNTK